MLIKKRSFLLNWLQRNLKKTRRSLYGCRTFIPGLAKRHRLESMVGPLGYWDKLQEYQLTALKQHGLSTSHSLLDIGCGPLQGGVAFIRYLNRGQYVGVDKSSRAIAEAYKQIISCNLYLKNPVLIQSENFGLNELKTRKFDYIWASQILYYFDLDKLDYLMQHIKMRLNKGGMFLGDILGPEHYEFKFPEHGYFLHTLNSINKLARKNGLKVECFGKISKHNYPRTLTLHTNLLLGIKK